MIGLKPGTKGVEVARLHRVLSFAGFWVEPIEIEAVEFGPSTLKALRTLLVQRGIPEGERLDEIDLLAHTTLIEIERTIVVEPVVVEPVAPTSSHRRPKDKGAVSGTLVDGDGAPIADARVTLLASGIRTQTTIGEARTNRSGQYSISYSRKSALNLSVQAAAASGEVLATSATIFAAAAKITVNLSSAFGGVPRQPSLYTQLTAAIAQSLGPDLKLTDLHEDKDTHELTFLANSLQTAFVQVAALYIAQVLAAQHKLEGETLFGLFVRGTPTSLSSALRSLPDAGIDATFCGQVFTALLTSNRAALDANLTAAIAKNILPASYSSGQAAQLDLLDALRVANVAATPFLHGKTSLSDLLAAGLVTDAVQTAFIAAYAANGGRIGSTWTALKANTALPAADLATLDAVLTAGDLLSGYLPLVKDTMARLAAKSLPGISQLAMLDEADWVARIQSVDPDATSIPPMLPNETPADRITRLAKNLTHRFAGRYPTMAFAGGLAKATTTAFTTKTDLVSFITANPTFSLHFTSVDNYLLTNKLQLSATAMTELKTAQRLHRVSPHYASVEGLMSIGHKSAQSIYFQGRTPFLAAATPALGSADLAQTAYARSQMIYASALLTYARFNLGFTGAGTSMLPAPKPAPGTLDNLPDLQALFGSLDSLQCDDCQSVYSPAAYLVDLLQYLSQFSVKALSSDPHVTALRNAKDAVLLRRPEIANVGLSCANTNVIIPYIDLVNEILEAAIAPPATPPAPVETAGTTAQRRAIPQQTQATVYDNAYALTRSVSFPLNLPFDVDFARTTAYIAALGTTRLALLNLFPAIATPTATAGAVLGVNSTMQAVIATPDTIDPNVRWGLNPNPGTVIDPKTRQSIPVSDWTGALNNVPYLLNASGLTLRQLYQLLEVTWVTQSSVTLQLGETTMAGLPILDPNTDNMKFSNFNAAVLDRANRFLRLWTASGLQMWELDWALELPQVKMLDNPALSFLAGAMTVQQQLNLPFQEVLTFWSTLIETRDVVSHLGDEDAIVPSTYTLDFGNPTMTAAFPSFQPAPPATGGAPILIPGQPTPGDLIPLNGISAALGLSSSDISAILSATGAQNNLNLATLTVLDRYATLAAALSLTIPDLILYIALSEQQPFGGSPADTLEFLRRLAVLQATSIADHDLDYLLRGQSASQTALAVTSTQITAFLQTVQTAVAKAISAGQIAISSVTDATPIVVVTAKPHGLTPGSTAQIFISGVLGDTAANGSFSASVTDATTLTLTGVATNGTWTSGGGVVTSVDSLNAIVSSIVLATIVAATGSSANVISPALQVDKAVTIDPATLTLLLASASPQPSDFPALVAAYTRASMAAELCSALSADPGAFAFLCLNASTFGWLNPATLPLTPVPSSGYASFETLLNALKLQSRQAAIAPKLFDVFLQWIKGPIPTDLATAIGGPSIVVTGASAATPIVITTQNPHNLQSGAQVTISGIEGNAAANGTFTITVGGPQQFSLNQSAGVTAWTSGGTVVADNTPTIAFALNAQASDAMVIATALNAQPPSLTSATQPGTLADIATLMLMANALDLVSRYGIEGSTLVQLAAAVPSSDTSNAAMGALQAQYPQSAWLAAVQPVEDSLRQKRRDALVAYLLGPGPAAAYAGGFQNTDDIFNYYLIDPEMCACGETTRLLQPSLAIQQFVQQAFLNLTVDVTVDMTDTLLWNEWSWRSQFQMWVANREVFLYPENYVLPELRTNASPFFTDLESDLRQSNCDAEAAEAAFENYLRKLSGVARLVVAAHYNQANSDGSVVLYVFAHTRGTPPQWFYRTRTTLNPGATGVWTAWEAMNIDIPDGQLVPVVWDRRLYLIWPMFKQCSEKSSQQNIPNVGGKTKPKPQAAARKFWAVQFAMSEFSAGQWQAKRLLDEKMFFNTEDPPAAFLFKAYQDSNFNLQILVFYTSSSSQLSVNALGGGPWGDTENFDITELIAQATLAYPDATLSIVQNGPAPSGQTSLPGSLPPSSIVDLSQEPTYSLINTGSPTNDTLDGAILQYTPIGFSYKGQDLVYGGWKVANPGIVPVSILYMTGPNIAFLGSENLLGQANNPRVVVPQNELVFDSMDPFFVADGSRTYLVQPEYFTVAKYPQQIESFNKYTQDWNVSYTFETFYHPYARTLLRELETGGISQLMSRTLQVTPQAIAKWPATFNFQKLFLPEPCVLSPYPGQVNTADPGETWLDFDPGCGGAYSLYNWEVFYHGPMFVASLLTQNQQFQDTLNWYEYIFNPGDNNMAPGSTPPAQPPVPARFWEFAPFYNMNLNNAAEWSQQDINQFLLTLAADSATQNLNNPFYTGAVSAIDAWMADPYDPHMIASTRITAYAKATVMQFLNNLLAWGDSLYAQYTSETVSQAEQLYVFADLILGPQPDQLRMPASQQTAAPTYASLKNIDPFSNVLVNVENLVVAPEPPQSLVQGTGNGSTLQQLPGNGNTLLFCIPPNAQLLAFWGSVAQRLYNIRNCLNMQGVPQPLPLYAPPINPLQLIAEQASGAGFSSTPANAPIYRFNTYLQKAVELTNEVRSYGAAILAALEKQDAESLAALRATQEINIQSMTLDVKNRQLTEAQDQVVVLQNQQAVTQLRYNYYSGQDFMNPWEITAISLQGGALIANAIGLILDMTSGVAHLAPTVAGGAAGFGGSPMVYVSYGGENIGHSTSSWANVARTIGGLLSEGGGIAATMGSYQHRQDEWTFQATLAQAELTQIASQITAAKDRVGIANSELNIQNTQIANAQSIGNFLTNKYTNAQLYNWMVTQLTTVYTQAYQLAYSLALQAQTAYQYELGRPLDTFIGYAYWDGQHRGLTAGDALLFDLRRMETQFIANNLRELEITMHVSLALTQPSALVNLLQSGSCTINLDETIFDRAYPGHYFRRLRSVALTVPCVTGPYTGVHAMLMLSSSVVRTAPPASGYVPYVAGNALPAGVYASSSVASTPVIVTSSGQNDAGLFDVNLRDERWLPFEGQGAVSSWSLSLDARDNDFDLSTITDVIVHVRYTARFGGGASFVRDALAKPPSNQRTILISTRSTFSNAYFSFFYPTDVTSTDQTLVLPLTADVFPFSNLGPPKITDIAIYFVLTEQSAGNIANGSLAATFEAPGPAAAMAIKFIPVAQQVGSVGGVAALMADSPYAAASTAHPGTFTLTVPQSGLQALPKLQAQVSGQARLDISQFDDIVLIVSYEVAS